MLNKLIVLLLMAVILYHSSEPNESIAAKASPTPSASENVKSEPFSVQISIPKQVKANQEFVISAELKNETGRDLEITTGSTAFYYVVRDSNGKVINSIARKDIGLTTSMPKGLSFQKNLNTGLKNRAPTRFPRLQNFRLKAEERMRSSK